MNLEINKNHKKVNLKRISTRNKIFSSVMAASLSLVLFSGCAKNNSNTNDNNYENIKIEINYDEVNKKVEEINHNGIVDVPNTLKKYIVEDSESPENEIITVDYLQSLKSLNISCFNMYDENSLLWLNYCTNLESLNILIYDDTVLSGVLPLPNLNNLCISNYGNYNVTLDRNNASILTSNNLKYLRLSQLNVEKGLLENLKQLETLDISSNTDFILINYDIDFSALTSLNELIISNPYTLVARLDSSEYEKLVESGIKITDSAGNNLKRTLISINNYLDETINNLNINQNMTDNEKLETILEYTLNTLEYNQESSERITNHDASLQEINEYYENGYLYGVTDNNTQISGNYAALITALCDRCNINSFVDVSDVQAWNLVELNGNYYYLDASIIDRNQNIYNESVTNENWYLRDVNEDLDNIHQTINLPDVLLIESIEEEVINDGVEDITNQKYKVTIGQKEFIIGAGALVGMLAGLGLAVNSKKKNMKIVQKQEKEKQIKM